MKYLRGAGLEFEKAISRGWSHARSAQLNATVAAVKNYILSPTATNIREVCYRYTAWMRQKPEEFNDRGQPIDDVFWQEMAAEYSFHRIQLEPRPHSRGEVGRRPRLPGEIIPAPVVAINRWTNPRNFKRAAKTGVVAANAGISAAQTATGTGLAAVVLTGAAVSATGVGLIATGLALTAATSILAATSAWKTKGHVNQLQDIYDNRNAHPFNKEQYCQQFQSQGLPVKSTDSYVQHDMIANHVLPYIIRKKQAKFCRKVVSAIPLVGTMETVRAVGKKGYKALAGTLGANRQHAAGWLAIHLIACDCLLVQAIIAELYSAEEMEWLKLQPYEELREYVAQKLKST